jgi:hypothetical protein
MKRKLLMTIAMTLAIGTLAACGKSEKEKLADQLQKDYGMSEEEAQFAAEVAQEIKESAGESDKTEEEQEEAVELSPEEERIASYKLVEPKSEIVNSKMGDPIIQVEDQIIPMDGSITVAELIDTLKNTYDFDIKVTMGANDDEVTGDSITTNQVGIMDDISIQDDLGKTFLHIRFAIESETPVKIYDCPVMMIDMNGIVNHYNVYSLNIFYAGNICAGTYTPLPAVEETDIYKERMAQYPKLKYDEIEGFLEKQGLEYELSGSNYKVSYNYGKRIKGSIYTYEPQRTVIFFVDNSTGLCTNLQYIDSNPIVTE